MDPRLREIRKIASEARWVEIDHQENIYMVSFTNGPSRINVYYSRMTVATIVDHPKHGRNSMYRKRVPFDVLRLIFKDPRAHTHLQGIKGYHMDGKHLDSIRWGK